MHSLALYVKEELLFTQNLSLENPADSHLCFQLAFSIDHLLCLSARSLMLFHLT